MNRRTAWLRPFVATCLAVTLAACGVPIDESAQPLPANFLPVRPPAASEPSTPSASASESVSTRPSVPPTISPEPTHSARLRLWFVQDDGLVATESDLGVDASPSQVIEALTTGPPTGDSVGGLRTVVGDPLTGLPLVSVAETTASPSASATASGDATVFFPQGVVTIRLAPAFSALLPAEQVLLLGQVVLSLAGSGQQAIAFTDDAGTPVAVPLPDGRLLDGPATARDYTSLIVRP